jgi:hypothetical protein
VTGESWMTEIGENVGGIYSKFARISLIIITMLLIFAGPTYVPYLMSRVQIGDFASTGIGFVLFALGIGLMLFLVKKKIITA